MPELSQVYRAAAEVQAFCQSHGWRFCFIGGIAVQRWGEPRLTKDADLTLLTGFGGEEYYIDLLLTKFQGRRDDPRRFALERRVLLLADSQGTEVDVALGAIPFEEHAVVRATQYDFGNGAQLVTCCAEDLIVYKVIAGRDRDWADVEVILMRQRGKLDLRLVQTELIPLLELAEKPEALARLDQKIKQLA